MADVVNLITLEPGDKLSIVGGATVEVATNPKDGVWIFARYLVSPGDPSLVGSRGNVLRPGRGGGPGVGVTRNPGGCTRAAALTVILCNPHQPT